MKIEYTHNNPFSAYGTVIDDKGNVVAHLKEDASMKDDGDTYWYSADAVSPDGKTEYSVRWETVDDWRSECARYDESAACDWDEFEITEI